MPKYVLRKKANMIRIQELRKHSVTSDIPIYIQWHTFHEDLLNITIDFSKNIIK